MNISNILPQLCRICQSDICLKYRTFNKNVVIDFITKIEL
jgi:hypothetical protein